MHFTWNEDVQAREDGAFFDALPDLPPAFAEFSRPRVVPIDWHKTENQGRIGSCQGNGLTSLLERLQWVLGKRVQLSRIFAYLATQKLDGLLGSDRGSTISGGIKLALQHGVPLETATGYPSKYPGRSDRARILTQANYDAGAEFKAVSSWRVGRNHDETLNFIGGGGGVSFGVAWYSGFIPRDRVVRRFNPRSVKGGHAMVVLGYDEHGNLEAANSHNDGPFKIEPPAWLQMLQHKRTRAVGLLGNTEPQPVNWLKDSPHFD